MCPKHFLIVLAVSFLPPYFLGSKAQEQPVFRAAVDVVAVDVTVLDREGHPLPGLTPDDLLVLVDGKARQIVSLDYISYVRDELAEKPLTIPSPFSSNVGARPGRLVVLVIDRENIPAGEGRAVMAAAAEFVDRLPPSDRVGLFTMPPGGPRVEFTSDRERVKAALSRLTGLGTDVMGEYTIGLAEALAIERELATGRNSMTFQEVVARECGVEPRELSCPEKLKLQALAIVEDSRRKTRESLTSLLGFVETLRDIEGPKSLILISGGFPQESESLAELAHLSRVAAEARAIVYAVKLDPSRVDVSRLRPSPTFEEERGLLTQGMGMLAGMTGGALFPTLGTGAPAFSHIERELTGSYLLAFQVEDTDRDARPHRIEVQVRHLDAGVVRSRSEFVIPIEPARKTAADRLTRALEAPFPSIGLPIRVATYAFRVSNEQEPKVIISAEIGNATVPVREASVALALIDENGNAAQSPIEELSGQASADALRHTVSTMVRPGRYTLRLAALDCDGNLGSVEHPFDVRLHAVEGMEVSDLLLADSTSNPPFPLTSGLTARSRDMAVYLEVYSNESEPPQDLVVLFEVLDKNGEKHYASSSASVERTENTDRRMARERFALGSLPPGDYSAKATLMRGETSLIEVTRPFELQPRAGIPAAEIDSIPAGPPRRYAEILERYQDGGFVAAARDLSQVPTESLEEALSFFMKVELNDQRLKAAALLHTDALLISVKNDSLHIDSARRFLDRIGDVASRSSLQRQWFLTVGYHFRGLNWDQEAMSVLEAAVGIFPRDVDILLLAGSVYEAVAWTWKGWTWSGLDRAEQYYRRALEADPEHKEARLRLGHVLMLQGRREDAEREIAWCLSRPGHPDIDLAAHLLMGDLYRERNDLARAIQSYRAALAIDPSCQVAAIALSHALLVAGDGMASRGILQDSLEREGEGGRPYDGWWRYLRGDSEKLLDMMAKMREEVR